MGEASGLNQSCAQMTRRKVFTQPRPIADCERKFVLRIVALEQIAKKLLVRMIQDGLLESKGKARSTTDQ